MRIAIFGTGGAAGYFGARLLQAGEDVSFVARGAHLQALRAAGLRLESPLGDALLAPVHASDRPEDIGPVDWVICGVKAWQVPDAAAAMRPLVEAHTAVLPIQNGVEAPDQLAAVLGSAHVVGGAAWIVSRVAAPGLIRHGGVEPRIALGELDGRRSPRVEALRAALDRAGIKVEVPDDIHGVLWSKLAFITAISGVGAVTRATAGELRAVPETRALLASAIAETMAVARAKGLTLPADLVERTLAFIDGLPSDATGSMQRDVAEGRPSELQAQNGALVRIGRECGVPTPTHAFLYGALLPQERRARG